VSRFGICFVDVSTNEFGLSSFLDDEKCTQFETLLLQLRPKEILHEKGALSPRTKKLLSLILGNVCMTSRPFPDPLRTEDLISLGNYFPSTWPEALQKARTNPLLMSAIGAAINYFEEVH
jgi:DNA mismatch repair protein MSH6